MYTARGLMMVLAFGVAGGALAEGMPYDHMHLTATDPEAAVKWYAEHMGGEEVGRHDRLKFGDVWFIFFKKDEGFPGSEGSTVDHIGISFPDLPAKMEELRAAGVKITGEIREIPGKLKFGFVEDPWGTKIEVMEDPATLGFHHIHLMDPEPTKLLDWYGNAFGGERTKYLDLLDAVRYGDVWLLVQKSAAPQAPTQGRAIDHLGWEVKDMEVDAEALKEKGVKFTMEPRPFNPAVAIAIAFVEDPSGTRIELVQRP